MMKTVPTYWARIFCGLRPGCDGVAARLLVDLKQNRVSVMFPEDTVMIGPVD